MRSSFSYASTDDYIEIQKAPDNFWIRKIHSLSELQSKNSRLIIDDILNYNVLERKIVPISIDGKKLYLPDFPSFSGHQLCNRFEEHTDDLRLAIMVKHVDRARSPNKS